MKDIIMCNMKNLLFWFCRWLEVVSPRMLLKTEVAMNVPLSFVLVTKFNLAVHEDKNRVPYVKVSVDSNLTCMSCV